jgi:carboxylate-amine ligase
VTRELLQAQLEVLSRPATSLAEARDELRGCRQTIGRLASEYDLAFFAAGTHPTAYWSAAHQTISKRYDEVMRDLQMLGERNLLCGMHVHVELPDPDTRVDIMRRAMPYVPIFIALATSSPFWRARRTGLMGYRLAAYDELPRTGVPPLFQSKAEFDSYVSALVGAGVIENSSYLWWAMRPSYKHPTLELRAPDSCTRLEDALTVAALYRSLLHHLVRNERQNAELTVVDRAIAVENKWRAQRYGIHGSFVDRGLGRAVSVAESTEALIAMVSEDARELGCEQEVAGARSILSRGTSADLQIAIFREAEQRTGSRNRAFQAVRDWLVEATLQ